MDSQELREVLEALEGDDDDFEDTSGEDRPNPPPQQDTNSPPQQDIVS